ncbi:MAG: hypothetical protein U0X73_12235 [Thermoanaerobaculia bacterium]
MRALADLRLKYGQIYDFSIVDEVYLLAQRKSRDCPQRSEADAVVLLAQFEGGDVSRLRVGLKIGPVNFESSKGRFCYQLYWDPQKGSIRQDSVEFY